LLVEVPHSGPLAARRILIVEDHDSIREVLHRALEKAGAWVRVTADGLSALQAIRAEVPDLILLDVGTPLVDGWQIIATLRRSERTAAVPVILETSSDDLQSYQRAQDMGAAAFISKPFRLHEVIETCRRVLEGDRPLRGVVAREQGPAKVRILGESGAMAEGVLVEIDPESAQIELGVPLPSQGSLAIVVSGMRRGARIRWSRGTEGAYVYGLGLLGEWDIAEA
jgi:DNA-binding response OmpR family regulator